MVFPLDLNPVYCLKIIVVHIIGITLLTASIFQPGVAITIASFLKSSVAIKSVQL